MISHMISQLCDITCDITVTQGSRWSANVTAGPCQWLAPDSEAQREAARAAGPSHVAYPFWSLISLALPHGIVKSNMAFLKDDSFTHTSCKRGWASRSEVHWDSVRTVFFVEMVGFDSEDLKRVGAHSPLGQKHTAWIRTGNLPVI